MQPSLPSNHSNHSQKKPRHRHSPSQLAALNELFELNEHPPLDQRTSLAERLGMETKTVNAWFQNKRASSKKRTRGVSHDIPPPLSIPGTHSASAPLANRHFEFDEYNDDEYYPLDSYRSSHSAPIVQHDLLSSFYSGNPDHSHFLTENDPIPRRMRMRPTAEQTEELRKLYNLNPHPTTEQRQILSDRIGMRYQSITNWFQNQRSLAKKRKEEDNDMAVFAVNGRIDHSQDQRQFSAFPPASKHPSLGLPPQSGHPSLVLRRSHSISPSMDEPSPRRSSSRRSSTPYGSSSTSFSRPRRSRPEPYQLDALRDLYTKTPTPTIEERSALALEIGMDVGKVTNWFRNLRQTARKRAKKSGSGDDDDYDSFQLHSTYYSSASRPGTPSLRSSSSTNDELMDLDVDEFDLQEIHSELGSDDEYQEAVTPSPIPSPSPPPTTHASRMAINNLNISKGVPYYADLEKVSATRHSGVKIEDALLLLSFHHHIMH